MLAYGHESIAMLDDMFVREQKNWKLYHCASIKWYVESDPAIKNVDSLLYSMSDGADGESEDRSLLIRYIVIHEEIPDGVIDSMGGYDDPFGLGYTLKIEYIPPPEPKRTRKSRRS